MRFSAASALLLCLWANHAAADLYRWVDPETGSVKFSSYPPPWFGDAAREKRSPKVEQIPAGKAAPAIEGTRPEGQEPAKPAPEAAAKLQAPVDSAQEDRRKSLLKQIATQGANLAAAKPEEGARIYAELADRVREYKSTEQYLSQVDAGGEAVRRAEWNEVSAGIEERRRRLVEQISGARIPPAGTAADSVRGAWLELGRQMVSFSLVDEALKLLDPKGAPARDAEQAALIGKTTQQWKPALDALAQPPAQ